MSRGYTEGLAARRAHTSDLRANRPRPGISEFDDRWLMARGGAALALANARFWTTVAPVVAGQLKRWERRARAIEDPTLQTLALQKLADERFNAEVAATLATLAPAAHRHAVVEAIVAYEVMYDFLDGLTEQPNENPLQTARELYRAFTDAVAPRNPASRDSQVRSYFVSLQRHDNGYLAELVDAVQRALAPLPRVDTIIPTARRAAARCAEAQIRLHAAPELGTSQLENWATSQALGTPLGWQEFVAGAASSVLAVHALISAAADQRTTSVDAQEIDNAYLSICALATILDSAIDHDRDKLAGQPGYISYCTDHDLLAHDAVSSARRAVEHASRLRHGAHHLMTLAGVAAYYISAPTASSDFARPITRQVRSGLQPLITPILAVMHCWRAGKRARDLSSSRIRDHRRAR
jgi:tetraprenyl-beta-curcumene synthase